jgi:ABC-type glutathione transport system ATPase component
VSAPVISCTAVSVAFDPRRPGARALDGVSLALARGDVLAVVGESGSGKTTLGRVLLGLVARTGGEVAILGQAVPADPRRYPAALRARIQPVFQDPGAALDPMRTVADALDEPLLLRTDLDRAARGARARELLSAVGLDAAHLARYPHELSGGQKQRVSIARALAAGPEILVLDEPLSALDVSTQGQVLRLLADLRARLGLTYVLVTHDLSVAARFATHVLVLSRGRAVESGPARSVLDRPAAAETRELLASVLSLDPEVARAQLGE